VGKHICNFNMKILEDRFFNFRSWRTRKLLSKLLLPLFPSIWCCSFTTSIACNFSQHLFPLLDFHNSYRLLHFFESQHFYCLQKEWLAFHLNFFISCTWLHFFHTTDRSIEDLKKSYAKEWPEQ